MQSWSRSTGEGPAECSIGDDDALLERNAFVEIRDVLFPGVETSLTRGLADARGLAGPVHRIRAAEVKGGKSELRARLPAGVRSRRGAARNLSLVRLSRLAGYPKQPADAFAFGPDADRVANGDLVGLHDVEESLIARDDDGAGRMRGPVVHALLAQD